MIHKNTVYGERFDGAHHKRSRTVWFFGLLAFFFLFSFGFNVLAQTKPATPLTPEQLKEFEAITASFAPIQPGTVNCFDYYNFGSVQVSVQAKVKKVVSGTPVYFSGAIENKNSYPIVNGYVYVKVYRKDNRPEVFQSQAHNQVDGFFALENINLDAKEKKPISFSWKVPAYAISGEYRVATFFVVDKKFNLLGLSFTDDIVGNTFDFEVSGEVKGGVYFNRDNVLIDGQKYRFASFIPKLDAKKPVIISAAILNNGKTDKTVPVSWKVCKWDALRSENCVDYPQNSVTVKAGERKEINFTVEDTSSPVYFVLATLSNKDAKSIIGPRFARDGVMGTRLNFPALTSFPLEKGASTTLFSCLHSMSDNPSVIPGGKLELLLTDEKGNQIYTKAYEGGVTGQMMGVAGEFIPKKSISKLTLSARLYNNGVLVDQSNLEYDCQKINPEKCLAKENFWQKNAQVVLIILFLLLVGLTISFGFYFLKRGKKHGA